MQHPIRHKSLALTIACLSFAVGGARALAQETSAPANLIDTYCSECHNEEDWAGSLDFALIDQANPLTNAETWEKVLRKFRGNMMPPQGNPRPSPEELATFSHWLTDTIDSATLAEKDSG